MSWNSDISRQLHEAFHEKDLGRFRQLLLDHPNHLLHEDGADIWMWKAAMGGNLAILQLLVELGLDVNLSHDKSDESDPFCEPEGPILQAATNGDTEMVRWLLEHGARINYTVNGQPRCLPLVRAATAGHMDTVRLLVEHGADIDSTWEGLNAITQADQFGHSNISDYLQASKQTRVTKSK